MINKIIIIIVIFDCDQLTEANSVILFVYGMMDSSVSFRFTYLTYIFYLWKC